MHDFEGVSRPVIFESEDENYPYWCKGSSFLVSNSDNCYWVSAAHVLENNEARAESLRIFPFDGSRQSLPFDEKYVVNRGISDDEEYKDILVLRIDLDHFDATGDSPLVSQSIDIGFLSATNLKPGDELWIIGFPAEQNGIDYEVNKIFNTRSVVRAIYVRTTPSIHVHELQVQSSICLESFDGLSGSPVYVFKDIEKEGTIYSFPMLVGMLVRGTASSGCARFIDSDVILNITKLAESRE